MYRNCTLFFFIRTQFLIFPVCRSFFPVHIFETNRYCKLLWLVFSCVEVWRWDIFIFHIHTNYVNLIRSCYLYIYNYEGMWTGIAEKQYIPARCNQPEVDQRQHYRPQQSNSRFTYLKGMNRRTIRSRFACTSVTHKEVARAGPD